jgi:hypothetical protein
MLTQQQWVEGCYAYYAENGYEPGNPEDGEWEAAHYPAPRCLGGEDVILLLREHHAVQGVLQSEEYQHPCIWGWEAAHLDVELLALCKKWRSEIARLSHTNRTPERRSTAASKGHANRTPEQRRAATTAAHTACRKPLRIIHPDGGTITCQSIAAAVFVLQLPRSNISDALRRYGGRLHYNYKPTGIHIEYA